MRRLLLLSSVAVVVWAGVAVPMPFVETRPGDAHPVEDLVTLSASAGPISGDLDLLTIRQTTPNILRSIWVGLHPGLHLAPADTRTPAGLDLDVYREIQAEAFSSAFTTAVAVAAVEAGYEIEVETRAVVAQVLPDGPSDGVLRSGDEITGLAGASLQTGAELVGLLEGRPEGPVDLQVLREGEPLDVTVDLAVLTELGRPGLGIIVETLSQPVNLPFDATLSETNIIGPSAGMMIALTATDLLLEEDLTAGRIIAGTGTIDGEGNVGAIGGIPEKVRAAIAADADLVLVPAEQLDLAREAAEGRVEVIGVATLKDALAALRGERTDVAAPRR